MIETNRETNNGFLCDADCRDLLWVFVCLAHVAVRPPFRTHVSRRLAVIAAATAAAATYSDTFLILPFSFFLSLLCHSAGWLHKTQEKSACRNVRICMRRENSVWIFIRVYADRLICACALPTDKQTRRTTSVSCLFLTVARWHQPSDFFSIFARSTHESHFSFLLLLLSFNCFIHCERVHNMHRMPRVRTLETLESRAWKM